LQFEHLTEHPGKMLQRNQFFGENCNIFAPYLVTWLNFFAGLFLPCKPAGMQDEKELVEKASKGDLRAFKLLLERHEQLVFWVCRRILNADADVEDVCQEVFIKVHQNLKQFHFQSKLSTWIAKIAHNTALNHLQKTQNRQKTQAAKFLEDQRLEIFETPETAFQELERVELLENLIAQLPEHYRSVLTLYHLQEFSYEEIAQITGMPDGTVKNYLFRARKMLKTQLEIFDKTEL
jgi:RNA polymerase sigma factor (sigma-70 family)